MKVAIAAVCAGLIAFAVVTSIKQAPAPTPAAFAESGTLREALAQSEATGKPVFALATASWCPPCQTLKKKTLTDPEVEAWIEANTIPVIIDVDQDPEAARALKVQGIPASFVLRGGEVVASSVGYSGPRAYLEFLKSGLPAD